jgi:sulfide:quinone oxidoreductase
MAIQITQHSPEFSTSAQIQAEDVAEIAQLGFKTIINNRPDLEGGTEQPTSDQIKKAAEKLGLHYIHIPVVPNNIQPNQIADFSSAFALSIKPVLGFCRTGNRASSLFKLAQDDSNPAPKSPFQAFRRWLQSKCLVTRLFKFCKAKLA